RTFARKMKPIHIFFTVIISTHLSNIIAQDALPEDSSDLLSKLESFKDAELKKAHKTIEKKQTAVIEVLNSHMDRETRAGNLDAALALKEKIASLNPPSVTKEDASTASTSGTPTEM